MSNNKITPIIGLLLNSAQGFYDVGFNCAYNLGKDNEITGFQRIAAGAVNMSFAAELFLKAVHLIINNNAIRGHELLQLFKALPQKSQLEIEERFNYHIKNNEEAKLLRAHKLVVTKVDSKTDKENVKNSDRNLLGFLTTHNLTFQNWRYVHEVKEVGYSYESDFKSMDCFLKSLIDFINSRPNINDLILKKK